MTETPTGSIRLPANAAAEEVRRRREENVDLEDQIRVLRSKQLENSEIIGTLGNVATWTEVPPTAPEEPAPEPIEDPNTEGEEVSDGDTSA